MHRGDDGLLHFVWKDRKSGQIEDDLILFPDEAEWLPVKQCTTGRVYVLKFKTSAQRLFFWMQEAKTDQDDEWSKKINQCLADPSAATMPTDEAMAGADEDDDGEAGQLQQLCKFKLL